MRSTLRALALGALLLSGAAAQAAPAQAAVMRPPGSGEACSYAVSADGMSGTGVCKNIGDHTIEFKIVVVCGWYPDQHSHWMTLAPGQSDGATRTCGGEGVGGIAVDVRDL
ncbi:hypothetical protein AB0M39_08060 [Streptomyces sp. NPDC051907]|uniref:hypothetical protein n=1 Tax=Streptomyces sp. NPDC051907 TaxID=3155284 RepID=UPI00343B9B92